MKTQPSRYQLLLSNFILLLLILCVVSSFGIASKADVLRSEASAKAANDVQLKTYPAFGDHFGYIITGYYCHELIESRRSLGGRAVLKEAWHCFSAGLRPWGMNFYSTIPHFITNDPILINHIRVLFNLICSLIVSLILLRYMAREFEPTSLKTYAMILVLAISLVPYIPVIMSDLISFTFFAIGLAYLRVVFTNWSQELWLKRSDYIKLCLSGLMCGIAVTMKQNYFVFSGFAVLAFLIVYRKTIFNQQKWYHTCYPALIFLCGFAFFLTQCFATYKHSGYFFIFSPKDYLPYSIGRSSLDRVSLELIAFNLPSSGAYIMSSDIWLNPISYFLVRFYLGMSKLYLPIYHGYMPIPTVQHQNIVKVYLFFFAFIGFTIYCYKTLSKELKALILTSVFIALFTAYIQHTENRYYFFPRLVYLMLIINVTFSFSYNILKSQFSVFWQKLRIYPKIPSKI